MMKSKINKNKGFKTRNLLGLVFGISLFLAVLMVVPVSGALSDDLLQYYKFSDTTEEVSNTFPLVNHEGSPFFQTNLCLIGTCANLTTGNSFNITNSNFNFSATRNGSVNLWFRANSADQPAETYPIYQSGIGWRLEYSNVGNVRLTDITTVIDPAGTKPEDAWTMYTITFNKTHVGLYENGVSAGKGTYISQNITGDFIIGNREGADTDYQGLIDEYMFYNRSLSPAEITTLYNGGSPIEVVILGEITVTLNIPTDNIFTINSSILFNATLAPTELVSLRNATLQIFDMSDNIVNQTTIISSGNVTNSSLFNISFQRAGTFKWNVIGCAKNDVSATICSQATSNFTFNSGLRINNEIFERFVTDLSNSNFILNVTLADYIIDSTGSLFYDKTSFSSTKSTVDGTILFKRVLEIPGIQSQQNRSFNWQISLTDSFGTTLVNSTTDQQQVTPTNFSQCSVPLPAQAINFTVYDESNPTVQLNSTFKAIFRWFIGGGLETKNNTFDLKGQPTYSFCINPNETYVTTSKIELFSPGFRTRIYNFIEEPYTNVSVNVNPALHRLFLANSSLARKVPIELVNEGNTPLPNYIIKIYRIVHEDDARLLVESKRTNNFGQASFSLIENDVDYILEFYDTENVLVKTISNFNLICKSTLCLTPFVIKTETEDFIRFKDLSDHTCSLGFNNATNLFTLSWNDNRGEEQLHRLQVTRIAANGTFVLFNQTRDSNVDSLIFGVGDSRSSYSAQAFRKVGDTETRLLCSYGVLTTRVGDLTAIFGFEGMMWGFILLFTLVLFGLWSPVAAIWLYLAGFIMLGITQIVYISPIFLIVNLVIGVLAIWALRQ